MKKKILLVLGMLPLVFSCSGKNDSVQSSSIAQSSEIQEETVDVTLKEILSVYKLMSNYTYTVKDEIFDMTSVLRYTRYAYYYSSDNEKHGGQDYGYAENEKGVFKYVIEKDGSISYDNYLLDKKGNYVHDMWFTTILSFLDVEIGALPDEPIEYEDEKNVYEIEDPMNKLLITSLCGYGDSVLQSYIRLYIKVTSNTSFQTIIYTEGLPGSYNGYVYGDVTSASTTIIPEIEKALENDGGPTEVDAALTEFLKKLTTNKNYTLSLSGAVNYEDRFTARYYYSTNLDDASANRGYANSADGVYRYTIKDGEIKPEEVISDGAGGVFSNFWSGLPNFFSFADVNLNKFTFTQSGEYYIVNDSSSIYNFAKIAHIEDSKAYNEKNKLKFQYKDGEMTFILEIDGVGTINGKVHSFDTTSIPEIEQYVANGGGALVYDNLDDIGRNYISSLAKKKNYTLKIKSTFTSNAFEMTKKFTATSYYEEKIKDGNKTSTAYLEKGDGVYKVTEYEGAFSLGDRTGKEGDFLWASSLFKGINVLDASKLAGKKIASNKYSITDSDNKNALSEIAGFSIYDLMFYSKGSTFTIKDASTLEGTFEIDLGNYGNVTIDVVDVDTTSINGINNL